MAQNLYDASDIIYALVCGLVLALTFLIGTVALSKMRQGTKAGRGIRSIFLASFVLAAFHPAMTLVLHLSHHDGILRVIPIFVVLFGFMFSLLTTLVLRLHLTFKESAFRMSSRVIYIFAVIYIIEIALVIVNAVGIVLNAIDSVEANAIGFPMITASWLSFMLVWLVASFVAVRFFVTNIWKIAKLRIHSQRNLESISLDSAQHQLLHVSARYILLYCLATASTILCNILFITLEFSDLSLFSDIFNSIDYCFNVLCLYLQFSFATEHYQCLCGCLDKRCRSFVLTKTTRSIHKELIGELSPPVTPAVSPADSCDDLSGVEVEISA